MTVFLWGGSETTVSGFSVRSRMQRRWLLESNVNRFHMSTSMYAKDKGKEVGEENVDPP